MTVGPTDGVMGVYADMPWPPGLRLHRLWPVGSTRFRRIWNDILLTDDKGTVNCLHEVVISGLNYLNKTQANILICKQFYSGDLMKLRLQHFCQHMF